MAPETSFSLQSTLPRPGFRKRSQAILASHGAYPTRRPQVALKCAFGTKPDTAMRFSSSRARPLSRSSCAPWTPGQLWDRQKGSKWGARATCSAKTWWLVGSPKVSTRNFQHPPFENRGASGSLKKNGEECPRAWRKGPRKFAREPEHIPLGDPRMRPETRLAQSPTWPFPSPSMREKRASSKRFFRIFAKISFSDNFYLTNKQSLIHPC